MRISSALIAILVASAWPAVAAAERDAITAGVAVGAGGQGTTTYGALELRLDAMWRGIRIGLGARGVWDGGVFRRSDWSRAADAVTLVRQLEASLPLGEDAQGHATGQVGIAAGALAPSRVARVTDGYRATLDDRQRTGARAALVTPSLSVGLEIDDVIDPALIGGELGWQLATPWGFHIAAAIDPSAPGSVAMTDGMRGAGTHVASSIEAGVTRRWDAEQRRLQIGGSLIGEPREGLSVVAFGSLALDRGGARWTASADLRGGNGTTGAMFGALYRVERLGPIERAGGGVGGGLALGVTAPAGSLSLGARARPGLGALATLGATAPMGRWVQAGGWVAASRGASAGAAELRVAWARRLSSALQVARMYATDDPMAITPAWSVTAWFGASTD